MAHILAIPYPLQGHINPMIQLCHRLSSKGIRVTFLTTVSVSTSLERQAEEGSNLINFETVPDSAIDGVEGLDVYEIFIKSFRAAITGGVVDIIEKHRNSGNPFTSIVYDSVNPWTLEIAHAKGLKGAVLFTQPCTVCSVFYHVYRGTLEIPPDDGRDVSLPGMPVMGVKDLPSLVYDTSCYTSLLTLLVEQFLTFERADWRLFNTFTELEEEILKWMANEYPVRAIGPTIPSMYMDKRLQGNYDYGLSLFKRKTDSCTKWLDQKEDRSVVYVSFGSLADLSVEQMEELACGLIEIEFSFLWVVRDTEQSKLPRDFISGPTEKGLIVNWCAQLEVLSHPAVGCFLTHCGWNSTLEALSLGVPILAMPHWTDQTTNAMLVVDVWRTGVRMKADGNGVVRREEIKKRVEDLMGRDRGGELRENASRWKGLAVEAVSEGGSSDHNITEFARDLMNIA